MPPMMFWALIVSLFVDPRIVIFFIWLLTDLTARFETYVWPFLGWLFLPYTTIAYIAALQASEGNISAGGWTWLVCVGLFCDIFVYIGQCINHKDELSECFR